MASAQHTTIGPGIGGARKPRLSTSASRFMQQYETPKPAATSAPPSEWQPAPGVEAKSPRPGAGLPPTTPPAAPGFRERPVTPPKPAPMSAPPQNTWQPSPGVQAKVPPGGFAPPYQRDVSGGMWRSGDDPSTRTSNYRSQWSSPTGQGAWMQGGPSETSAPPWLSGVGTAKPFTPGLGPVTAESGMPGLPYRGGLTGVDTLADMVRQAQGLSAAMSSPAMDSNRSAMSMFDTPVETRATSNMAVMPDVGTSSQGLGGYGRSIPDMIDSVVAQSNRASGNSEIGTAAANEPTAAASDAVEDTAARDAAQFLVDSGRVTGADALYIAQALAELGLSVREDGVVYRVGNEEQQFGSLESGNALLGQIMPRVRELKEQAKAKEANADAPAYLKFLEELKNLQTPELDRASMEENIRAQSALRARRNSQAMLAALEGGGSPERSMGLIGEISSQGAAEDAEMSSRMRMQAEVQNLQMQLEEVRMKASALTMAATMAQDDAQRAAATEAAKAMAMLQFELQKKLAAYQDSLVSGWDYLAGILGGVAQGAATAGTGKLLDWALK